MYPSIPCLETHDRYVRATCRVQSVCRGARAMAPRESGRLPLDVRRCSAIIFVVLPMALFAWRRFGTQPMHITTVKNELPLVTVALAVSGVSRGPLVLRRFADALSKHVIQRASSTHRFDAFVCLQDDESELLLNQLLVRDAAVRMCTSRHQALRQGLLTDTDETVAIAKDHAPENYGAAWRGTISTNTLRMLYKLRCVEQLRVQMLKGQQQQQQHQWVLRVRPDLELLEPLTLPPLASFVYAPWACSASRLVSDQLLLLPAVQPPGAKDEEGSAAERLGALYEPRNLLQTVHRSEPPSLYPERLVWHALQGFELRTWPARLRLVSSDGEPRDAYAKLKDDFPSCFEPT